MSEEEPMNGKKLDPTELAAKAFATAPMGVLIFALLYGFLWLLEKHDLHQLKMLADLLELVGAP